MSLTSVVSRTVSKFRRRYVFTDMNRPIHLLANSVFGQSIFVIGPDKVDYISLETNDIIINYPTNGASRDWPCWVAFRTGDLPLMTSYVIEGGFTESMKQYPNYFGASTVLIQYDEANCIRYQNATNLPCSIWPKSRPRIPLTPILLLRGGSLTASWPAVSPVLHKATKM